MHTVSHPADACASRWCSTSASSTSSPRTPAGHGSRWCERRTGCGCRDRFRADPPAYLFESLDFPVTERKIDAFHAEFPPDAPPSELHRHEGAELIYVLSGKLAVRVDEEETILGPGDAMYFDSGAPHSYRRHGRSACAAIVVVAP